MAISGREHRLAVKSAEAIERAFDGLDMATLLPPQFAGTFEVLSTTGGEVADPQRPLWQRFPLTYRHHIALAVIHALLCNLAILAISHPDEEVQRAATLLFAAVLAAVPPAIDAKNAHKRND